MSHPHSSDNNNLILNHFLSYDFATSLDDAQWIARKIAKLTKEDIKKLVLAASFPREVQGILVEKLVARRNSLLTVCDCVRIVIRNGLSLVGVNAPEKM